MNIDNKQDQNHVALNQIECVEQEKMEYKLIDTFLHAPGLKLRFYNPETEVIEKEVQKEPLNLFEKQFKGLRKKCQGCDCDRKAFPNKMNNYKSKKRNKR